MNRTLTAIRQAASQARGFLRWCLPEGHGWTGRNPDRDPDVGPPDWRGICTTCGKVAAPRPTWRRFILMGDCVPDDEAPSVTLDNSEARFTPILPLKPHYPDEEPQA